MSDELVKDGGPSPPKKVREAMRDAQNVTGAEFLPPYDLDGYLDEPEMKFGLWVGESEDDAELVTFEISGEQIEGFAEAFQRAAEDATEVKEE